MNTSYSLFLTVNNMSQFIHLEGCHVMCIRYWREG